MQNYIFTIPEMTWTVVETSFVTLVNKLRPRPRRAVFQIDIISS